MSPSRAGGAEGGERSTCKVDTASQQIEKLTGDWKFKKKLEMNLGLKPEMEEIRNETQKMEIKLEIERQYMKNKTNEENWVEVHNKESGKWTKSGFITGKWAGVFLCTVR